MITRYAILLAMLLLCLPVRVWAWQVVGGGLTGPSFSWSMENSAPEICLGDACTPIFRYSAELTTSQAYAGAQSLGLAALGYSMAEFGDTGNIPNPCYNYSEGTVQFRFRWTGTWGSGTQHFYLKDEDYTGGIYVAQRGTVGQLRFFYVGDSGANVYITFSGVESADTWYLVTLKWDTDSATAKLSAQVNNNSPVVSTTTLPDITHSTRQILIGNDSSIVQSFFIDDFKVWNYAIE